jgi:adenylate kinase family enzyme
MAAPTGILLFGPNGSGKTTTGRELARVLGWKHIDAEDIFFEPSDVPYTNPHSREEAARLLLAEVERCRRFVLTSVTGDYGDEIMRMYRLAVYLSAPLAMRLERFDQREYVRHGERVSQGGDMYESHNKFRDHIANRPLEKIDRWGETLTCPVIRMDTTVDWRVNAELIAEKYESIINKGGNS